MTPLGVLVGLKVGSGFNSGWYRMNSGGVDKVFVIIFWVAGAISGRRVWAGTSIISIIWDDRGAGRIRCVCGAGLNESIL